MGTCALHRYHWPRALTDESHHVIPQAWQRFVEARRAEMPLQAAAEIARVPAAFELWDRETVDLCPTGHRNVHVWIVRLMKVAVSEDRNDDPLAAKLALLGGAELTREQKIAYDALTRFAATSGGVGLEDLRGAKLWGQG